MAKTGIGSSKKTGTTGRVRVGVIGVGGMGSGHCRQITDKVPDMKLSAVCDIDPETAERVGEAYKVPSFRSHRKLIAAGLCDAVTIATPHPSHAPIAVDCMKAGLHVLSEKPLSEKISGAERMVRAAKKNKVAFAVMFQRRFQPQFRKAIDLVEQGKLGRVIRATLISPEYRSQAYYDSGTWRATWSGEGGGVMLNQAPHIMDIFVQLVGLPVSVRGTVDTRMHDIEVEDFAEATLRLKDGGTAYFTCSTNEPRPGQMIEVFGDKGKLILRDGEIRFFRYLKPVEHFTRTHNAMWGDPPQKEVALRLSSRKTGHYSVLRNFARHILRGDPLVCSGESGLASLELANAITLSSYRDREVRLPIGRRAYDSLLASLRKNSTCRKKAAPADRRVTDPQHQV